MNKIIKSTYYYKNGKYFLPFKIEEQPYNLKLDLSLTYIYLVNSNQFVKKDMLTKIYTDYIKGEKVYAEVYRKKFKISNAYSCEVPFYIYYNLSNPSKIGEHSLGLAYHFNNDYYSYRQRLYDYQWINSLKFAIEPYDKKSNKGNIYFGGVPEELLKLNTSYEFCNVKGNFWGCMLSEATFYKDNVNSNYVSESFANFSLSKREIIVPYSFFEYLFYYILQNQLRNEKCLTLKNEEGMILIQCECEIIQEMPNVNFTFDNVTISFEMSELVEKKNSIITFGPTCEFIFHTGLQINDWDFGNLIFKKHLVIFNEYCHTIDFIYWEIKSESNFYKVKCVFIIASIIQISNLLFLLYNKYKIS